MKTTVKIFNIYTNNLIATFETSSKNIQKSVYQFMNRNYEKFKISSTETYYRF